MATYPVRCCCDPGRILGWLAGPDSPSWVIPMRASLADSPAATHTRIEVLVREFRGRDGRTERAISSDDRPLEFWLTVPGFVPA